MRNPRNSLNVVIATPFGSGGRGGMDRLSDAIVEAVDEKHVNVNVRVLATYGPKGKALMPFYFMAALLKVTLDWVLGRVDILHINVAHGGSLYRKAILALWAHFLAIPYVIHVHGSRVRETWPSSSRFGAWLLNGFFEKSQRTIVLGRIYSDYISKHLPSMASKITVLPNAVRSRPVKIGRGQPRKSVHIGFLGLLGARKGSLILIEALSRLDPNLNWTATIAGDGNVAEHRSAVARLGLSDRITLPGWLGPAETDQLLGDVDLLVLPSQAENLPMSILEAFAHGVPVVATPVGAVEEVVAHEVNGLLVPVGDVAALTKAIEELVASKELRERLGWAARKTHLERFELTSYADRLVDTWRYCLVGDAWKSRGLAERNIRQGKAAN